MPTMTQAVRAAARLMARQSRIVSAASSRSSTCVQFFAPTHRPMSMATREGAAKASKAAAPAAATRSQSSMAMAADVVEDYSFLPFSKVIPLKNLPAAVPAAAWQAGRQRCSVCAFSRDWQRCARVALAVAHDMLTGMLLVDA